MDAALASDATAADPGRDPWDDPCSEPLDAWLESHAPPEVELRPPETPAALMAWFREGPPEVDDCEWLLASAARARGAIDVSTAEGLDCVRRGDRLETLGCHFVDYAREVLDLDKSAAESLARLGGALRTRPLLREALRSGTVGLRAAETVWKVAVGEAEAEWVERAGRLTVRELEHEVRRAGADPADADDPWLRLNTHLPPDERAVVDAALDLARRMDPEASRLEAWEMLSQEYLAEFPDDPDADDARRLRETFQAIGPRPRSDSASRRAVLEAETRRWCLLPDVDDCPAPEVRFSESDTAKDVDGALRELAKLRAGWDEVIGYCAHVLKSSDVHVLFGFASFRHYCEERLRLPARAIEQRAALEGRVWASPALQEARRQKLPFEKLRLLAKLPEREIASWTPRAHALTCIALKRKLEGERERQMRASGKLSVSLPRRIAVVLAAAFRAVRKRVGGLISAGSCLAIMACHFMKTWEHAWKRGKSRSEKVRERDHGWCQVPGCSHRASHAHHVIPRAQGGSDDPENLVALCAFHHLRCIHGGYLRVFGRAPDGLTWFLCGSPWKGPLSAPREGSTSGATHPPAPGPAREREWRPARDG